MCWIISKCDQVFNKIWNVWAGLIVALETRPVYCSIFLEVLANYFGKYWSSVCKTSSGLGLWTHSCENWFVMVWQWWFLHGFNNPLDNVKVNRYVPETSQTWKTRSWNSGCRGNGGGEKRISCCSWLGW